jgi:DNA-directed RNA polymerase specialized sigma24 family protein
MPLDTQELVQPDINRILEQYAKPVLCFCLLCLGDPLLAEEAAQDSLLAAYSHHGGLPEKRREKQWILRMAAGVCGQYMRRSYYRESNEWLMQRLPDTAGPDRDTLHGLFRLRSWERALLVLCGCLECSAREAARLLRLRLRTAQQALASIPDYLTYARDCLAMPALCGRLERCFAGIDLSENARLRIVRKAEGPPLPPRRHMVWKRLLLPAMAALFLLSILAAVVLFGGAGGAKSDTPGDAVPVQEIRVSQ